VVVVHGGFWRSRYDCSLGRPLAGDLVRRGYTVWNLEYRRMGDGGGWPTTFDDVAAGLGALAELDVDTSAVVAVGHSAGGHLATWAASPDAAARARGRALPRVTGVVSQAGVLDLIDAVPLSNGAVVDLLGGTPDEVPDRYAAATPPVPPPVPVVCVHASGDDNVPIAQSEDFVARAAGRASLARASGDHFTLIDPAHPDWLLAVEALPALIAGELPRP
jgi:acetyl esterase/lipase